MGAFAGPNISENSLVLALDAANKKSYSQNEFQYSTDIVTFSGTGGANSTITRDTISSPVGNTPLKMVVTGNDPYVASMYNTPSKNIAPAANGQTWIVSVYIKANVATTGQIFIFGAAADGNVFNAVTGQISAGGVSIGTDWTRVQYAFTFTKGISFIQVRLDGPDSGGTGQTVWWDGLQVERVPAGTTTPTPFTSSYYGGSVYKDLVGSNNGTLVNYPTYSGSNSGSLVFDGTNDYVSIPNPITSNLPYTVLQWIKPNVALPDTTSSNSRKTPLVGPGPIWNPGYWMTARVFRVHAQTEYRDVTINWVGDTGWHQVGQIFDGTTCYTVIDGSVLLGTRTGYNPTVPSTILLGAETTTGSGVNWNGNISNTTFYGRALTAAEIQQNFNATRSRYSI
jgi:hypothetical protein